MPRRATDKEQEAWIQLGLLSQTIGRQIHFVTIPAVLWAINFVPGSVLLPLSFTLFFFFFFFGRGGGAGVFVSLMLLTSVPTAFRCFILSLHHEPQVSGACVCVYVYARVSAYWGVVLLGIKWRRSLEKDRLFFRVAEILPTNWMRCKSSQQASDFDVTHTGERAGEWGRHKRASQTSVFVPNVSSLYQPPPVHRDTLTHTHSHNANAGDPLHL